MLEVLLWFGVVIGELAKECVVGVDLIVGLTVLDVAMC